MGMCIEAMELCMFYKWLRLPKLGNMGRNFFKIYYTPSENDKFVDSYRIWK